MRWMTWLAMSAGPYREEDDGHGVAPLVADHALKPLPELVVFPPQRVDEGRLRLRRLVLDLRAAGQHRQLRARRLGPGRCRPRHVIDTHFDFCNLEL